MNIEKIIKKIRLAIGGGKTVIGTFGNSTIAFLLAKNYIDVPTSIYIGSVFTLILGWGIVHKVQKAKKKNSL